VAVHFDSAQCTENRTLSGAEVSCYEGFNLNARLYYRLGRVGGQTLIVHVKHSQVDQIESGNEI